ncbi:MAG: peptidylprolyl isomerase [Planctomycetales bacterium]|nr:peptidylprolyl isomerase [Planctomycetales bacterium]
MAFPKMNSLVQRFCWLLVLALSLSSSLAQEKAAPPPSPLSAIPPVVALVDGQTISREQLANECLLRYGPIVLDNLQNKQLILQACIAQGITITNADVDNEISRMANKFGLSAKLFLDAIQQERDIKPSQYANEIVWPMLALRALAADKIQVSREEIDRALQSEYGEKVQVRMIALSDYKRAEELFAQAKAAPEQFRRLAKQFSEDAASASVEGLLPPIRRFGGDDQLESMAFQLQPNQISPIFKVGELYVFLQCVRLYPATPPSPQVLPAIEQRIADGLRDQRLAGAADQIFATLKSNARIVTIIGNPDLEKRYPNIAGFINDEPITRDFLALECINRHGREILRGEINRVLLTQMLSKSNKTVTPADISAEISRAADTMGYIRADGSPDVEGWLKSVIEEDGVTSDLYIKDAVWPSVALHKLVEDSIQITQEDLQKGFEANYGPRAEILAVVTSNQRTAEEVFRKARENLTEQNFGQLAAEYSIEPISRANFGKVPPIRRHGGQPTLEKVAFDLSPGEVSAIVALDDNFAVLYKQGESTPIVQDFEAVKPELIKDIHEKKIRAAMQQKLDEILHAAQIENLLEGSTQLSNQDIKSARQTIAPINR